MAKTKTLATLGPASFDKIEEMVQAGLDGFRLNMPHFKDYDFTAKVISDIRTKAPNAFIVADLEGPKIRLGTLEKPIPIEIGQEIKIAPQSDCPPGHVPIQVEHVYKHVHPGINLLINDGAVRLEVTDIKDKIIYLKVICGTQLESRKGVNIPFAYVPMQFLSEKDKKNLVFLVNQGVDYISASFTQCAENILEAREYMGNSDIELIAKIENAEGLKNLHSILKTTKTVMVARGDLGMEIGTEYVPENQKDIIFECNAAGIMVITATQMLEGMVTKLEAQRAEASDIFNAVLDGTDVTMLSIETSMGQYPIEAIRYMNSVLDRAEKYLLTSGRSKELAQRIIPCLNDSFEDNVSRYASTNMRGIGAIITPTISGYTTRRIARFRPDAPIIALTPNKTVARQLNAVWGVNPYVAEFNREDLIHVALNYVQEHNIVPKGTNVIIASGSKTGMTDTIHFATIE